MNNKLNLNKGLIAENYTIVPNEDIEKWEKRGFSIIENYPIFLYEPNKKEKIMLGMPLTIEEFGIEKLIDGEIIGCDLCGGDYGMGSLGFFELKIQTVKDEIRLLSFCSYSSGSHILFDDRIIESHSDFYQEYHPWIQEEPNNLKAFEDKLSGSVIKNIQISPEECTIEICAPDNSFHTFWTALESNKFPPSFNLNEKDEEDDEEDVSYSPQTIAEIIIVTYDNTVISV